MCARRETEEDGKRGKDTLTSNQIRNNKICIKQQRTLFIGFVFLFVFTVTTRHIKTLTEDEIDLFLNEACGWGIYLFVCIPSM